jgi:hypothetical protein
MAWVSALGSPRVRCSIFRRLQRALWLLAVLAVVATMSAAPWSARESGAQRAQRTRSQPRRSATETLGNRVCGGERDDHGDGVQLPVQSPSRTASKLCP